MHTTTLRLATTRLRLALVLAVVASGLGLTPGNVVAAGEPILLVHGYRGSPANFDTMRARFTADGREAVAIALPSQDNIVNARAIRDFILRRRWSKFDVVGHSMGGLSSRYFAKSLSGTAKLDAYVSLGTPQRGIYTACALPSWYGGQMCPYSSFITNLNSGDDTPGNPAYTTIYSTTDYYVPASRSRLDGGACHVEVSGVSHSELLTNEGVYRFASAATERTCSGVFVP